MIVCAYFTSIFLCNLFDIVVLSLLLSKMDFCCSIIKFCIC
jgi:hypothetical protein